MFVYFKGPSMKTTSQTSLENKFMLDICPYEHRY